MDKSGIVVSWDVGAGEGEGESQELGSVVKG